MVEQTFFIFTPKIGEMSQFDEHIFQMGWFSHQLVFFIKEGEDWLIHIDTTQRQSDHQKMLLPPLPAAFVCSPPEVGLFLFLNMILCFSLGFEYGAKGRKNTVLFTIT